MSFLFSVLGFSTGSGVLDVLFFIFLCIFSILISTHVYTTCRFQLAIRDGGVNGKGIEPPTLPYRIPYYGNMFSMANLHGLYEEAA